jgi:hypothetical protein
LEARARPQVTSGAPGRQLGDDVPLRGLGEHLGIAAL